MCILNWEFTIQSEQTNVYLFYLFLHDLPLTFPFFSFIVKLVQQFHLFLVPVGLCVLPLLMQVHGNCVSVSEKGFLLVSAFSELFLGSLELFLSEGVSLAVKIKPSINIMKESVPNPCAFLEAYFIILSRAIHINRPKENQTQNKR